MSIELREVTKRYHDHVALDAVTVTAVPGGLTALVGPSGSGKTTALRAMAGLERLDGGRVLDDGVDVTDVAPRRRRVGFCFQDYAPFWHLRVVDNVAYGPRAWGRGRRDAHRRALELLELVQLDGFARRYPRQLSGGQRQRMALARALAIEPRVLLLDEPFAALDAVVRAELRGWVRGLQRELGLTTVLVTHDRAEAMEMADEVVVLRDGRVEQTGRPRELYDRPANEFVRSFFGPTVDLGGRSYRPHELTLRRVAEDPPARVTAVTHLGFEVRVHVRADGDESWVQLARFEADALGLEVGDGVVVTPRLYEVAPASTRSSRAPTTSTSR